MRYVSFILLFVAAIAMSASAMAQPPREGRGGERGPGERGQRGDQEAGPRGPAALMAALDANKDGTLSKKKSKTRPKR